MVSKSIAIAYSYTKQHRKKMNRIIPIFSFTTGETKKKKKTIKPKKKKRERYVKCPSCWLSPSNLMQAIFTAGKH
jgi:hypothetical protein